MSYYKERHNEIIDENVEVLKIPNLSFHKKCGASNISDLVEHFQWAP
jgi:hypothetical protein